MGLYFSIIARVRKVRYFSQAGQWHASKRVSYGDWENSTLSIRVVPSEIQYLERKRGQYQDSSVFGALTERNVASKPRHLWNVWEKPCRGLRFVTLVTFCFLCHIFWTQKNTYCVTNSRIVTRFKSVTLWHFEIQQLYLWIARNHQLQEQHCRHHDGVGSFRNHSQSRVYKNIIYSYAYIHIHMHIYIYIYRHVYDTYTYTYSHGFGNFEFK